MKALIRLLLAGTLTVSVLACQKSGQTSTKDVSPSGTVDGGGGDTVIDPKNGNGTLLDLAEEAEKSPFDFNIESLLKEKYGEQGYVKYWIAYQKMRFENTKYAFLGENSDFFSWALPTVMNSNEEVTPVHHDQSLDEIYMDSFGLKDRQRIQNLQYAFTNKPLKEIADEGIVNIQNPEDKLQLAIQDDKGHVIINRQQFDKLDIDSKIALKIHESVLHIVLRFNPSLIKKSGTAPIRKFVRTIFSYAYLAEVSGTQPVSKQDLKEAYDGLELPVVKADYSAIAKISDANQDPNSICELKRGEYQMADPNDPKKTVKFLSANYFFEKNGKQVSGYYSMDPEFYMKLQVHLAKLGICTFKPKPCAIETAKPESSSEITGKMYNLVRDGMALPTFNDDFQFIQGKILENYRTARICE